MNQKKRKRETNCNMELRPLATKVYEDLGALDAQFIFKGKGAPAGLTFYDNKVRVKGLTQHITYNFILLSFIFVLLR
jgi:hypothetical protein